MNTSTAYALYSDIHADEDIAPRNSRVSRMRSTDEEWDFKMTRKARSKAERKDRNAIRAVKFQASDFLNDEDEDRGLLGR
ncbi:hypothetical protein [Citricoccus nitrophenolicus]|uniref:hypothetical protein n=1 Tax=Citricoccus nitrophenolicus TaxID=863575 RepID=UPI0031EDD1D8